MFKPRLRISRPSSLARLSQPSAPTTSTSSPAPWAVTQKHQQRSIHATPVRRAGKFEVPKTSEDLNQHGIEGLLSRDAYNLAWTNYQTWLIAELNKLLTDKFENKTVKEVAIMTSREPSEAQIFNYASMAHNNEFFFNGIASSIQGDPDSRIIPKGFRDQLEQSFGSIETLKREMIFTANAMFGPGFVWLVKQNDFTYQKMAGDFRILTTYLAGSPYPGAHWRRQDVDMNHVAGETDIDGETTRRYFEKQNKFNNRHQLAGSQTQAQENKRSPGGADVIPVLCVNTWNHVYMPDYGCEGKLDYLSNWWERINWSKVVERANPGLPRRQRTVTSEFDPRSLRKEVPIY